MDGRILCHDLLDRSFIAKGNQVCPRLATGGRILVDFGHELLIANSFRNLGILLVQDCAASQLLGYHALEGAYHCVALEASSAILLAVQLFASVELFDLLDALL